MFSKAAMVRWHDSVYNYQQVLQRLNRCKRIVSVWNERMTMYVYYAWFVRDFFLESSVRSKNRHSWFFIHIFSDKKSFWEQNWNELNRPWLRLLELSPTFPCIRWDWSILVAVISKRSQPLTKQGAPSKKVQRCQGVQINVCHKLGLYDVHLEIWTCWPAIQPSPWRGRGRKGLWWGFFGGAF